MPPKKKQEQIDLSTLPECNSANLFVYVRGKKVRSQIIQTHIINQLSSIVSKISRAQIMDFSKEKGIYVDPNTLNQKQKKDPKFMESICTELTPEVFAKGYRALIQSKNLKVRIDKKSAQQKGLKKIIDTKFDWFYIANNVAQTKEQFEALANHQNNIKFVLIIVPKLSWSNSPYPEGEIPQNLQEQQEEDQDLKQFKQLKQKQTFTEQDIKHQREIQQFVSKIKSFRKQSSRQSQFRDTFIGEVECQIDPYNQKQFGNQVVKALTQKIQKLSNQFSQYLEWKNGKTAQSIEIHNREIGNKQQKIDGQENAQQIKQKKHLQTSFKAKGQSHLQILLNLIQDTYESSNSQNQKMVLKEDDQQIQSLINGFDFSGGEEQKYDKNQSGNKQDDFVDDEQITTKMRKRTGTSSFINQNQIENHGFGNNSHDNCLRNNSYNIRRNLTFPGIDRHMMPDIPTQSKALRKLNQSFFTKFIPKSMGFEQLQRRISLKKFEELLKDFDQERDFTQTINQRVYEQFHDEKSLMRQLYRAMALNQGHFITKYNPQNDKLYIATHYKTNQRRIHKKIWENSWKIIPNYENWLKYFKDSQNNLNNQEFYDIDYQKIGNIDEKAYAFCVPDGGVILKKYSKVSNFQNKFLYAIKNHHIFGVNHHSNTFYSQNQNTKIYHYQILSSVQNNLYNQSETLLILGDGLEIRLKQSGDIIIEDKKDTSKSGKRLYTANGYTVLYDKSIQDYKILHPNGGISTAKSYINELGYGLQGNILQHIPTLLRRQEQYEIIKRDDGTITINQIQQTSQGRKIKKWIKFQDGTQYLLQNSQIQIQKIGIPFVSINKDTKQIKVSTEQFQIIGKISSDSHQQGLSSDFYSFLINFHDGNRLQVSGNSIKVSQELSQIPYIVDLGKKTFQVQFGNQKIQISYSNQNICKYYRNNKSYDHYDQQIEQGDNQQPGSKDFLQPKLFVINSNNTGVQLLTENQLSYYFHNKEKPELSNKNNKKNIISRINQKVQGSEIQIEKVYIISKLGASQDTSKRINPDHKIKLDIYQPMKLKKSQSLQTTYAIRTLIKYKPMTLSDSQQLSDMIKQKDDLYKELQKDQNQFGHKGKEALQEIIKKQKDKIIMIQFRKKEVRHKNFEQLKQQAIKELNHQQKLHMTMIQQQEKQTIIRNRMMEKKKSIIQPYPQINLKDKQQIEEVYFDQNSSGCFPHYFQTLQGKKALAQMPQWVFRPKTAKQKKQLDPQIVSQMNNTMNKTKKSSDAQFKQKEERYDTVDINLNPVREIIIKPSVFTQRQIDEQRDAFQHQKKAYKYHESKRKDFNIYGNDRQDKIQVSSLMRTQPISEINQKYLITQAPVDKKIKISSMKNKLTSQASSLTEMRKQGPHNTLLKTIDKRNDYSTLLQKRTMMVHADLNDKLQRDILINPIQANFGFLREGRLYQLKITVKNQDIIAQRLVVKKPRTVCAKVYMNELGPIALGMSRKISVQIKTSVLGKFQDEFQIVSKHEIYRIPIIANVLSQGQYQSEHIQLGKNVRQIVQISGKKGGRSSMDLPPLN